jgi:hypothetical protein
MVSAVYEVALFDFRAHIQGPAEVVADFGAQRPVGPAWARVANAALVTTFELRPEASRPDWYQLLRDGEPLGIRYGPTALLAHLDRAVNAAAVAHLEKHYLLLHAGAVSAGGRGVLLPAASGSGKSTLVAGLVAAGCDYLSDEVAVLDPATGHLLPFQNPLGIKAGARRALSALYPCLRTLPGGRIDRQLVWHMPAPAEAWPTGPVSVQFVIVPRYVSGAQPSLVPLSRTVALEVLTSQTSGLGTHGVAALELLIGVLRGAVCYALTAGNLRQSVDLVQACVSAT